MRSLRRYMVRVAPTGCSIRCSSAECARSSCSLESSDCCTRWCLRPFSGMASAATSLRAGRTRVYTTFPPLSACHFAAFGIPFRWPVSFSGARASDGPYGASMITALWSECYSSHRKRTKLPGTANRRSQTFGALAAFSPVPLTPHSRHIHTLQNGVLKLSHCARVSTI